MSQNIKEVGSANFEAEVLKSDLPVLVDFWAPWCGPCLALAPILEENLAKPLLGVIKFVKVNIDNTHDIAERYGIKSIPTLILFQNGSEVSRGIGGMEGIKIIEDFVKKLQKIP